MITKSRSSSEIEAAKVITEMEMKADVEKKALQNRREKNAEDLKKSAKGKDEKSAGRKWKRCFWLACCLFIKKVNFRNF